MHYNKEFGKCVCGMQAMEKAVSQALGEGSQDDVLSEGFRLTITRKDLQTLSRLNWLNDEVSITNCSIAPLCGLCTSDSLINV